MIVPIWRTPLTRQRWNQNQWVDTPKTIFWFFVKGNDFKNEFSRVVRVICVFKGYSQIWRFLRFFQVFKGFEGFCAIYECNMCNLDLYTWTVVEYVKKKTPLPIIDLSFNFKFQPHWHQRTNANMHAINKRA